MAGLVAQRFDWPAENGVTISLVAVTEQRVRIVQWYRHNDADEYWHPERTSLVDLSLDNARDLAAYLQEQLALIDRQYKQVGTFTDKTGTERPVYAGPHIPLTAE